MPYALFSNDAKLSKTYPTEADVWKVARKSGLVIDVVSEEAKAAPCPVLENDYEIRPCSPDPHEDPAKNQADETTRERPYGVAFASEACSEASDTQALRRCSPLIAPVTLSTFPAGQDASCTKATS